jgi:3-methyladenine DNA glycosylase AlkD
MSLTSAAVKKALKSYAIASKVKILSSFFKTGPGGYSEGDIFIGTNMPSIRKVAGEFKELPKRSILELMNSKVHEERMCGLLIVVDNYKKKDKDEWFNFYVDNLACVNCWDLVDVTCPHVVGEHLLEGDKSILLDWIDNENPWIRRCAILACFPQIKANDFAMIMKLSKITLDDPFDLNHKASGWMLREVAKRDKPLLLGFIKDNYDNIPRVMLRYSIEKFPVAERKQLLKGKVSGATKRLREVSNG